MTFEAQSMATIGRSLDILICNGNKVIEVTGTDIIYTELVHLKVLTHL
jgi:hypothetical protein